MTLECFVTENFATWKDSLTTALRRISWGSTKTKKTRHGFVFMQRQCIRIWDSSECSNFSLYVVEIRDCITDLVTILVQILFNLIWFGSSSSSSLEADLAFISNSSILCTDTNHNTTNYFPSICCFVFWSNYIVYFLPWFREFILLTFFLKISVKDLVRRKLWKGKFRIAFHWSSVENVMLATPHCLINGKLLYPWLSCMHLYILLDFHLPLKLINTHN